MEHVPHDAHERLMESASRYRSFCEAAGKRLWQDAENAQCLVALSYVFLGCKPAVLWQAHYPPELPAILAHYGIKHIDRMFYDEVQVRAVMANHPDIFADFSSNPDILMQVLQENSDARSIAALGVLLGFPKTSAVAFADRSAGSSLAYDAMINVLDSLEAEGSDVSVILVGKDGRLEEIDR